MHGGVNFEGDAVESLAGVDDARATVSCGKCRCYPWRYAPRAGFGAMRETCFSPRSVAPAPGLRPDPVRPAAASPAARRFIRLGHNFSRASASYSADSFPRNSTASPGSGTRFSRLTVMVSPLPDVKFGGAHSLRRTAACVTERQLGLRCTLRHSGAVRSWRREPDRRPRCVEAKPSNTEVVRRIAGVRPLPLRLHARLARTSWNVVSRRQLAGRTSRGWRSCASGIGAEERTADSCSPDGSRTEPRRCASACGMVLMRCRGDEQPALLGIMLLEDEHASPRAILFFGTALSFGETAPLRRRAALDPVGVGRWAERGWRVNKRVIHADIGGGRQR